MQQLVNSDWSVHFCYHVNIESVLKIYYHPNSSLHEMGSEHLESPRRLAIIKESLESSDVKCSFIKSNRARDTDILSIHTEELFGALMKSSSMPRTKVTMDTFTNMFTFEAAMTAVGASLQVVDNLSDSHGFSMIRPPGHHASATESMGFCFFNNIAIAAKRLSEKVRRVAIIDIDNHFGNGTASIFFDDPNVLYISLHADPEVSYPGSGYAENVGSGEGFGKTVNIPLPWKLQDGDYLTAIDEVAIPILEQFKPEATLVSLGLDGLNNDPYGALGLTPLCFYEVGRRIGKLARKTKYYVGSFLEGGYKYEEIGLATVAFFKGLLNPDNPEQIKPRLSGKFEFTLRKIKAIQRNHWIGL